MSNLWTFGDSYTAEYLYDNNDSYTKYKEIIGKEIETWPTILSKRLNTKLKNLGKRGSGNSDIFENLINNIRNIETGDVVIIGWGLNSKFRIANGDQLMTLFPFGSYPNCEMTKESLNLISKNKENKIWNTEIYFYENIIEYISELKNFHVFFWNSEDPNLIYGLSNKSKKKYILSESNIGLVFYLKNLGAKTISDDTNNIINDNHFGEDGHDLQADCFYKHIKQFL